MAWPGSLQQSNGVFKLELSGTSTLYEGTQFCLYFTEKKCTKAWICGRQRLCYPSGHADQVCCSKENAQLCQPFPRVLTSATEGELNSLLKDELLRLTPLGFQHKQTIESMLFNLLNDSTPLWVKRVAVGKSG